MIIWFTGISGVGKTLIAKQIGKSFPSNRFFSLAAQNLNNQNENKIIRILQAMFRIPIKNQLKFQQRQKKKRNIYSTSTILFFDDLSKSCGISRYSFLLTSLIIFSEIKYIPAFTK